MINGEMKLIRRENWLLTERYLKELKSEDNNISDVSIDRYEFSLKHLLLWAGDLSFEEALNSKSQSFTNYVANLPARRGDGKIALESQKKIILVSKKFLEWAKNERAKGTRKITTKNLKKLVHPKIVPSTADPESVSLEEIRKIASFDFGNSLVLLRDVAALIFAFLSGARAGAIASAPIKAINLRDMFFLQYPALGVKTKNQKSAQTFLLPIDDLVSIVKRWDDIVRSELPDTAPWYALFDNHWGDYSLSEKEGGEHREDSLSGRFGIIYEIAGMKDLYKSAHKFRHGHAVYGLSKCKNMAEYQAVSRNLMHSNLAITDSIYAVIGSQERQKIISSFVPEYKPDNESQKQRNIFSGFLPDYEPTLEQDLEAYLFQINKFDRAKAISILANSLIEKTK